MSLAGANILVTGASSGIGEAVAIAAGQAGANVLVSARRADRLATLVRTIGTNAHAFPGDLTLEGDVEAVFAGAIAQAGSIDALVHCVGVVDHTPIEELTLDHWNWVMDANLTRRCYAHVPPSSI